MIPDILKRSELAPRFMEGIRREKRIVNGPFKGMHYEGHSICSESDPKFLGTYEIELAPTLLNWRQIPFNTIIDVGAAEGYYAVGLSLLFPDSHVIAFETTESGRSLLTHLAELNRVTSRIELRGHCDLRELHSIMSNKNPLLVIMDIEGGEKELLSPEKIPEFHNAYIIVELHDCFDPGVGDLIKNRLMTSHDIQEIWTRGRQYSDFSVPSNPLYRKYLLPYLKQYASECRPEAMRWFVCTPKIKTN